MVKSSGSGVNFPGFKLWLYLLLAVQSWSGFLIFLSSSFLKNQDNDNIYFHCCCIVHIKEIIYGKALSQSLAHKCLVNISFYYYSYYSMSQGNRCTFGSATEIIIQFQTMKPQEAPGVLDPTVSCLPFYICCLWNKSDFSKNSITQTAGFRLPWIECHPVD